jgi:hypothetical protein
MKQTRERNASTTGSWLAGGQNEVGSCGHGARSMVGTVGGGRGNIPHVTSGKYWKVISELFHSFDFSLGEEHRVFFLCARLFAASCSSV